MATITIDKAQYAVGEKVKFTAEGLMANKKYLVGFYAPEKNLFIGVEFTSDSYGKISGEVLVGSNLADYGLSSFTKFGVLDPSTNTIVVLTNIKIIGSSIDEMMKSMMEMFIPMMSLMMFMNVMMSMISGMAGIFAGGM